MTKSVSYETCVAQLVKVNTEGLLDLYIAVQLVSTIFNISIKDLMRDIQGAAK